MARRYEKPEALVRIRGDRHQVIEASAGTGKTYTLEHLIIELLLVRKYDIGKILVVTFTEKATGELVARVRAKLEEILGGEWKDAPAGCPAWEIDDEARALLQRALFSFDTASISTIHSFCQRVLTEHAFAHRRLFDQAAVDESSAFSSAFRDVLRRDFARDAALGAYLGAWLSQGSLDDLEKLLRECWRARGTLRPEFDPAKLAAAILALPRYDAAVEKALASIHGGTKKALIARFGPLDEIAERLRGGENLASLLTVIEGARLDYLRDKSEVVGEVGAAARLLAAAQYIERLSVGLKPAVAQLFLDRVAVRAREQKIAAGQFDFQDMLSLVQESLEEKGHGDELAATLRRRYHAALIDEFQDTDDVQWTIFRRIFVDPLPNAGALASTLFVIGDPKQAIYGFRGADVHTYFSARAALGQPLPLTKNFRSTPLLVSAYNEILASDAAPSFFDGEIRYEHPVQAGKAGLVALGPDGRALTPIHLLCPTSSEGKLSAGAAKRALSNRIATEIRALLDPATPSLRFGDGAQAKAIAAGDIYVLTRSTSEGYLVGEELRAHGIAHAFYKQDGLFERPEASHVYDLLRALGDPHDRSKRLRAWLTPFFALALRDLDGLRELPGTDPLIQRLFHWKALADGRDYAGLFSRIMEESGIVRRELFLRDSERELTNYLHLFEILLEEAGQSHGTLDDLTRKLGAFIEGTSLPEGESGGVQRLESDRNAVQIMSIHKSKGLEAAVVFVFGGFSDYDPSSVHVFHDGESGRIAWVGKTSGEVEKAIKKERREEDQRLLYVAITRAKARLYLPYFRAVKTTDGKGKLKVSEEFARLNGPYRQLNDRLRQLLTRSAEPAIAKLFSLEELQPAVEGGVEGAEERLLAEWRVPKALTEVLDESAGYEESKRLHAGFVVTSYSGLKRGHGGYRTTGDATDSDENGDRNEEQDDDLADPLELVVASDGITPLEARVDDLPGSKNSGNFLHALLEEVPLEGLCSPQAAMSLERWAHDKAVQEVLERNAGQYGIEPRYLPHSRRLIHTALTSPVRLRGGVVMPGLCRAHPRLVREMEFLYPIPESHHPRLTEVVAGAPARDRFRVERGFIRGFVDLVFEHEGLTYLADWKSDSLAGWERSRVDAHVARNYRLQAQFYSLAMVKVLDVHDEETYRKRFGGFLYCFLRGMRAGGSGVEGVHFECPAWPTILEWEQDLLRADLLAAEERS